MTGNPVQKELGEYWRVVESVKAVDLSKQWEDVVFDAAGYFDRHVLNQAALILRSEAAGVKSPLAHQ
jgi:hypothetical protein